MIDQCLKALLFSMIKLIGLLDDTKFTMFKYFLTALLDCTKNLKNVTKIIICNFAIAPDIPDKD